MENATHHSSWERIHLIFWIIVIITAFPCMALFNRVVPQHWPSESKAELEQIRQELPLAEARWKAHNITDYEIDLYVESSSTTWCGVFENGMISWDEPHHLRIRQGEIIFASDNQKSTFNECKLDAFIPPKVFDTIKRSLEEADPKSEYLQVEFDPEYGFVSSYAFTSNYPARPGPWVQHTLGNFHAAKP